MHEPAVDLPAPSEAEEIAADYASIGHSMGRHPVALLRPHLARFRIEPASRLAAFPHGRITRAAGLVTHRQRPDTASGVVFVTLEDDTGCVNVVVWPQLVERYRAAVLGARLMAVFGVWQRDQHSGGQVAHLVARRIVDHTALLGRLAARSRDFR